MVATDLFGRGMDIERVNIVFNYDMPENSDTYLHRVRRSQFVQFDVCVWMSLGDLYVQFTFRLLGLDVLAPRVWPSHLYQMKAMLVS